MRQQKTKEGKPDMANIQQELFTWQAVEASEDLKILQHVVELFADSPLIDKLEEKRAGRQNRYPVRPMFNTVIARFVLGHVSDAAMIRELRRNAELRQLLGFDPLMGSDAAPSTDAFSRFRINLADYVDGLEAVFTSITSELIAELPTMGTNVAVDGKAVHSFMKSDKEAGVGTKKTTDENETVLYTWHGWKIHALCDADLEIPIAFEVTKAKRNDCPELMPLVKKAFRHHPTLIGHMEVLCGDKGYDDGTVKKLLLDKYNIDAIIPSRDLAQGEMKALDEKVHDTIYVSPTGEVCCKIDPFHKDEEKKYCPMEFKGYEKDRQTLKFRCPAAAFGCECKNKQACKSKAKNQGHGRTIRVPLEKDPRLFTSTYQHGRKFEKAYRKRTSIERLFYRLDHMFGLEVPMRCKGLKNAKMHITLAFIAMSATALSWIKMEREEMIRSRLQTSAA